MSSNTKIHNDIQAEDPGRRFSSSSQGDARQPWQQSSGVEPPLPNRQMSYAQPSLAPLAPLDLGFLPKASASQYSLLEAVVGPNHAQYTQPQPQPQPQHQPRSARPSESSVHSSSRVPSSSEATHTSFGTSTEKSWDVLSDASLKMNREDQDVEELQKKVDKRKSKLPALEGELAALEARIKEAEERLARAQANGVTG